MLGLRRYQYSNSRRLTTLLDEEGVNTYARSFHTNLADIDVHVDDNRGLKTLRNVQLHKHSRTKFDSALDASDHFVIQDHVAVAPFKL